MRPALKAALDRIRAVLLAAAAGGSASVSGQAHAALGLEQQLPSAAEQQSWAAAQARRTPAAYQRYLELFPTGLYAEEAFRRLIETAVPEPPVKRMVDIEPPLAPGGPQQRRVVVTEALGLY